MKRSISNYVIVLMVAVASSLCSGTPSMAQKIQIYENPDLSIEDKKKILRMYGGDKHDVSGKDVMRVENSGSYTLRGGRNLSSELADAKAEQMNRWRREIAAEEKGKAASDATLFMGQAAIMAAQSNESVKGVGAEDFDFYHNDRISHSDASVPMEDLNIQSLFNESVSRFDSPEESTGSARISEPKTRSPKECYEAFISGENLSDEEMRLANEYNISLPAQPSFTESFSKPSKDEISSEPVVDSPEASNLLSQSSEFKTESYALNTINLSGRVLCSLPGQGVYSLVKRKLIPLSKSAKQPSYIVPKGVLNVISNARRVLLLSESEVWDFTTTKTEMIDGISAGDGTLHLGEDGSIYQTTGSDGVTEIKLWTDSLKVFTKCLNFPGDIDKFTVTQDGIPVVLSSGVVFVNNGSEWIEWYEYDENPIQDIMPMGANLIAADSNWVIGMLGEKAGTIVTMRGGSKLLFDGVTLFLIDNNNLFSIL